LGILSNSKYNIQMADPYFTDEDRVFIHKEVDNILSGLLSMGPNVKAFEQEFAQMVGVRHAIAMNSCTSALEAALIGLGLKPGDEVIVPVETFIATGMAVLLAGGVPVFAEITPDTFCLDINDVRKRITSHTFAVILVYMAGLIPDGVDELRRYCEEQGLFLIEDAAHAPGAKRNGQAAGSFGHAGCFSFFPTKVITAGEGGMLTTNDDKLANIIKSLQHRGRDLDSPAEQYCRPGRNVRMTEIAALLGRVQLSHLSDFLAERRRVANIYRQGFSDDKRINIILPQEEEASSCWKVPVLLPVSIDRKEVTDYMHESGVFVDWSYNPPLHLQPVFRNLQGTKEGQLPISEDILSRSICLPCHPRISDDEAKHVVSSLKTIFDKLGESNDY
jgi:perosamine synthetase